MFDVMKVAREIKEARLTKNMTQMELAEEMGVSYQAVSNWERGNSMPDIGKLESLCGVLGIELDRLLGVKRQVESIQKVMDATGGKAESALSLDDISTAAPLMKPDEIEKCVEDTLEKQTEIELWMLSGLAPFVEQATLESLAERLEEVSAGELLGVAPFLGQSTLGKLVEKLDEITPEELLGLAPFLKKESVNGLAMKITTVDFSMVSALAPFVDKEVLGKMIKNIK